MVSSRLMATKLTTENAGVEKAGGEKDQFTGYRQFQLSHKCKTETQEHLGIGEELY